MVLLGHSSTFCLLFCTLLCFTWASPITMRPRAPLPSLSSFFKQNPYTLTSASSQQANVQLSSLLTGQGQRGSIILFLTHFADLSSFELAQETLYYLPQLKENRIRLSAIGPGSLGNAEEFCRLTNFPKECLYLDPSAGLYKELEFNRGPLPKQAISPYVKLGAMLMGIGSPGTIPEVIRGYVGDRSASSSWIKQSLRLVEREKFDVLGTNYQRPFELATIRLQNMLDILQHWSVLAPEDSSLLTQLGGAFVFKEEGDALAYEHRDLGILKYVDLKRAVGSLGVQLVD